MKIIMKIWIALSLMITGLHDIHAQVARDIIHVNYTYMPYAGFKEQEGKVQASQFDIFGSFKPMRLGNSVDFLNALYYRHTQFQYDGSFQYRNGFPEQLHDVRYLLAFRIKMDRRWTLLMLPQFILWGDLERPLNGKDLIAQTGFILSYNHEKDYKLRVGLGGNAGLFEYRHLRFMPLVQLKYQKRKLNCEIALPYGNFTYRFTKDLEAGIFAMADNSFSAVTPFDYENQTAYHLRIFQLIVAPTLSHRLFGNFYGHVKIGGMAPIRSFRPFDEDFKKIDNLKFGPASSLFFKIGFSYRRPE